MQDKRLGRGLSALLGESKVRVEENSNDAVKLIALNKIIAGAYQPRKHFNQNELNDLANSITQNGLIQPIILRKIRDDHYEIVAGERRFRAAKIANLDKIPAIVKNISDTEALEMGIVENIQRSDLSAIEESEGYKRLIEEFSYTHDEIAKKTGKSRSHITNYLRLLSLPVAVQKLIADNTISMGHARAIINSTDPQKIAQKITQETLSVRDVEELVHQEKAKKTTHNKPHAKSPKKQELLDLSHNITKSLKAKVRMSFGDGEAGKITINFVDFNEAKRIAKKLA